VISLFYLCPGCEIGLRGKALKIDGLDLQTTETVKKLWVEFDPESDGIINMFSFLLRLQFSLFMSRKRL